MADVAAMLRDKLDHDKADAKSKTDQEKHQIAEAPGDSGGAKKVVEVKGKGVVAASPKAGAKKVVAAKGKAKSHKN